MIANKMGLPPGTVITFEKTKTTDGGSFELTKEASGTGPGLSAAGEKIVTDFNGSAPNAALGDGQQATGGTADISTKIIGGSNLWSNPMMIAGILGIFAGAFGFYRHNIRAGLICCGVGIGLIAAAMNPVWIYVVAGLTVAVLLVAYLNRELTAKDLAEKGTKAKEALRAVVAGVANFGDAAKDPNNPTVPPEAYATLKSHIESHTDASDKAVITSIKLEDNL